MSTIFEKMNIVAVTLKVKVQCNDHPPLEPQKVVMGSNIPLTVQVSMTIYFAADRFTTGLAQNWNLLEAYKL